MKILVTGSQGYIGSLLAPMLMQRGHQVIGVDTQFYRAGQLYQGAELTVLTLNKDIRHITAEDIQGIEAIVHMAESNDLTGQRSQTIAYDINHKGSVHLANIAKTVGVRRVYTSSCNVYGVATDDYITEESPVNPQTTYAICKTLVERDVRAIALYQFFSYFSAECYRLWCITENALRHLSKQFSRASIAKIVAEVFKCCQLSFGESEWDNSSYRVSFEKINKTLPGFKCEWNVQRGTQQLFDLFSLVDMSKYSLFFQNSYRLNQLDYLIDTQKLSKNFPVASKAIRKN